MQQTINQIISNPDNYLLISGCSRISGCTHFGLKLADSMGISASFNHVQEQKKNDTWIPAIKDSINSQNIERLILTGCTIREVGILYHYYQQFFPNKIKELIIILPPHFGAQFDEINDMTLARQIVRNSFYADEQVPDFKLITSGLQSTQQDNSLYLPAPRLMQAKGQLDKGLAVMGYFGHQLNRDFVKRMLRIMTNLNIDNKHMLLLSIDQQEKEMIFDENYMLKHRMKGRKHLKTEKFDQAMLALHNNGGIYFTDGVWSAVEALYNGIAFCVLDNNPENSSFYRRLHQAIGQQINLLDLSQQHKKILHRIKNTLFCQANYYSYFTEPHIIKLYQRVLQATASQFVVAHERLIKSAKQAATIKPCLHQHQYQHQSPADKLRTTMRPPLPSQQTRSRQLSSLRSG